MTPPGRLAGRPTLSRCASSACGFRSWRGADLDVAMAAVPPAYRRRACKGVTVLRAPPLEGRTEGSGRSRAGPIAGAAMAESDWDTVTVLRKKGPSAAQAKSKQVSAAAAVGPSPAGQRPLPPALRHVTAPPAWCCQGNLAQATPPPLLGARAGRRPGAGAVLEATSSPGRPPPPVPGGGAFPAGICLWQGVPQAPPQRAPRPLFLCASGFSVEAQFLPAWPSLLLLQAALVASSIQCWGQANGGNAPPCG